MTACLCQSPACVCCRLVRVAAVSTVCCDQVVGVPRDWDQVGPWHGSEAVCSEGGDQVLVCGPVPSCCMVWSLLWYKTLEIDMLFLQECHITPLSAEKYFLS